MSKLQATEAIHVTCSLVTGACLWSAGYLIISDHSCVAVPECRVPAQAAETHTGQGESSMVSEQLVTRYDLELGEFAQFITIT